jgi:CelD/BcsL family acetyltransferase involved in cellulose biosynthesis
MAEFISGDFNALRKQWLELYEIAGGRLLFSSPDWSELWWQHFGQGNELHLGIIEEDGRCIGIAPLRLNQGTAYFIGSDNVCDFLDFIIEPGKEKLFFGTLLDHLKALGVNTLDLSSLLPDSSVRSFLTDISAGRNLPTACTQEDVTIVLDLPPDLPAYLASLSGKQRHELLRKERRLNEEGDVSYRIATAASPRDVEVFARFFRESREDKNRFLTDQMKAFFEALVYKASSTQLLEMGILELNKMPVAVTLGFNFRNMSYLYNSGYNPDYKWLSVGLISKYYYIKNGIESGRKLFDFLKGAEKYKYYLGGQDIHLFRCIINLNG